MRLIDADELLQTEKFLDTDLIRNSKEANWLYEQMIYDIANAPTIDAQPVVHAYWKRNDDFLFTCSNCGRLPLLNGAEDDELSPYCPHCGAKMDGKEERHD
jgi:hypothetical protein